jgi:hypothetical protein
MSRPAYVLLPQEDLDLIKINIRNLKIDIENFLGDKNCYLSSRICLRLTALEELILHGTEEDD